MAMAMADEIPSLHLCHDSPCVLACLLLDSAVGYGVCVTILSVRGRGYRGKDLGDQGYTYIHPWFLNRVFHILRRDIRSTKGEVREG